MGLTFAKGEEPDEYFCEQCKPENHVVLLEKMNRGEKPWEEVAKERERIAQEKRSRKRKGGKRGRKPRASEVKAEPAAARTPSKEASQPAPESKRATPAARVAATPTSPELPNSQKRKFEQQAESHEPVSTPHHPYFRHLLTLKAPQGPKPKLQRVSTGPHSPPTDVIRSPVKERKPSAASTSTPIPPSRKPSAASTVQGQGPALSPLVGVPSPPGQLSAARSNVAKALAKQFIESVVASQKQGTFTIPEGQTNETYGGNIGFAIEQAMYRHLCGNAGEPNAAYKAQLRTILFNVKQNSSLRDSLLVGTTTPDAIATMSTQDMASEELRRKEEAIKREAERQAILLQETGPRIRRTHKGEEFVEDESHMVGTDSVFSTAPARRDTMTEQTAMSPRAASPPTTRPEFQFGGPDRPQRPQVDTQVAADGEKRRSSNFDIQNVWSSVQSPGHHHDQVFAPYTTQAPVAPPPGHKVQADAEIDQLLRDDDMESPPYSPKDFSADSLVWHGRVVMNSVTDFAANARFAGGADLSGRIPWSKMVPPTVQVDGRIDIKLATDYLCELRYSHSTELTVIALHPPDSPDGAAQFNRLFDYFVHRKRYGVMKNHPHPSVKDTYMVPVEAGSRKTPEFIELLENNAVEEPNPGRLLLVIFVIKTGPSSTPSTQHPTPREQQHHPSIGSAISPGTALPGSTPQQTHHSPPTAPPTQNGPSAPERESPPYVPPPPQPYQQPHPEAQEPTGAAAAAQHLGHFANAPAIQQLLRQVPYVTGDQFKLIAGILARQPDAANDYQALMNAILQEQGRPSA